MHGACGYSSRRETCRQSRRESAAESGDDAAMKMSHRDRVERVADPFGRTCRQNLVDHRRWRCQGSVRMIPSGAWYFWLCESRSCGSPAVTPMPGAGTPTGIHRLRTTTRRLRSELRSLEELVDGRWRDQLDAELKWLAGRLGEVRDLDILLARLKKGAGRAGRGGGGTGSARRRCSRRCRPVARRLRGRSMTHLRSDRYRGFLASLEQAALNVRRSSDAAAEPCRVALPDGRGGLLAAAQERGAKPAARPIPTSHFMSCASMPSARATRPS